jgi:hypothetical protein
MADAASANLVRGFSLKRPRPPGKWTGPTPSVTPNGVTPAVGQLTMGACR